MREVYIDVNEWVNSANTVGEIRLIKKYAKTGWYNEASYNSVINAMKVDAKNYDDQTYYSISYYFDFEDYYQEVEGTELARDI